MSKVSAVPSPRATKLSIIIGINMQIIFLIASNPF